MCLSPFPWLLSIKIHYFLRNKYINKFKQYVAGEMAYVAGKEGENVEKEKVTILRAGKKNKLSAHIKY